ncbi:MAG: beta-lactamase family protein [Desulfobacterales bacterium]|nr:beta-lactamase family protein [Desulfobacterales bacterium]
MTGSPMYDFSDIRASLQAEMDRAVGQGVFPGGQFVVIEGGESVFEVVAGTLSKNNQGAVTPETYYDLASLTKPLVGLNLSLFLVSSGLLDLDRDLAYYLPDLKGHALETVTPAHLLSHTSGLPAWRAFYEELALLSECDRHSFLKQAIRHCDLEAIPGKVRCYSDIGFMLLQEVVERVAGDGAKNLYNMHILGKLGLKEPVYSADLEGTFRVASTEVCPWRMKALCGEVHDDNAWVLGGEALHAGLFGSARGVGELVWAMHEAWLGVGGLGDSALYHRALFSDFSLGVDHPSSIGSASGRGFGPGSWGHLGFTGTSFWVDPGRGVVVILLTNRVHPSRENSAIRQFRPRIHDLFMSMRYGVCLDSR